MKNVTTVSSFCVALVCSITFAATAQQNDNPARYAVAGVVKTFALGKANPPISSANKSLLDQVAAASKQRPCLRARIVATADVNEYDRYHELQNSNLADRRCNAIRNELFSRGVPHLQMDCAPSFYDTPREDRSVTIVWDFEQCVVEGHGRDIESLKDTVMGHGDRLDGIDHVNDVQDRRIAALERDGGSRREYSIIDGNVGVGILGFLGEQELTFGVATISIEWNFSPRVGAYGEFLAGIGSPDSLPEADAGSDVGHLFGGGYGLYVRVGSMGRIFVGGEHLGVTSHHPGYTDFWSHMAVIGGQVVIGDDGPDDYVAGFIGAKFGVGNGIPTKSTAFVTYTLEATAGFHW